MFQFSQTNPVASFWLAVILTTSLLLQAFVPLAAFANEEAPTETTPEVVVEEVTEEDEETEPVVETTNEVTEEEVEEEETPTTATAVAEDESNEQSPEPATEEAPEKVTEEETEGEEIVLTIDESEAHNETETGDAKASLEAEQDINTNVTDTNASNTDGTTASSSDTNASSTKTSTLPPASVGNGSTTVSNTNEATSTLKADLTADTGQNIGSGGHVSIDTGNAVAYADVLNVVNTNITNSEGLVDFVNDVLGFSDFDVRDDFETAFSNLGVAVSTPACSLIACGGNTNFTVLNDNEAVIDNDVTVIANTGNNVAGGNSAYISTGDAYASANIINVANTNITDSNYLLLVFNNFDSYAGDIVLPNSSFFTEYFAGSGGAGGIEVTNDNTADVTNNVNVTADTGSNQATGSDAAIVTGDAGAIGSVHNQVNQNIFGANSFSMLVRVHGDWSGDIYGLPEGMSWQETPEGIHLYYTTAAGGNVPRNVADRVHNSNRATINNNVNVFALTGDNTALGNQAGISTGNAYADASVMNLANNNIVGSNWSNLIFNIYGNWNGNLAFGQPDLWLGVRAKTHETPAMPGSEVTYTYTVFNNGDVPAENTILENMVADGLLTFADAEVNQRSDGKHFTSWQLGTIPPGETREFSHTAQLSRSLGESPQTPIPLVARVSSQQPDANDADNEDTVTVYAGTNPDRRSKSEDRGGAFGAKIEIHKDANRDTITPGEQVTYTITVRNHGGKLYDAALVDILEDGRGEKVSEQIWPLNLVNTNEEIVIEYTTSFDANTPLDTYTNYAQVIGLHDSTKPKYRVPYMSALVTHELTLVDGPVGEVLGATAPRCSKYLSTYLRYGIDNDPAEVEKLQRFLNDYSGTTIVVSGVFDVPTEIAVRKFQQKYATDILGPWGLERDSGYVYYTTQKKINELYCDNEVAFPLSENQQNEIAWFSQGGLGLRHFASNTGTDEPPKAQPIPAILLSRLNVHAPTELRDIAIDLPNFTTISSTPTHRSVFSSVLNQVVSWFKNTSTHLGMSLR